MPVRRAVAIALILAAAGASADDAERARGAAHLAPFKQSLQQALQDGLARGPVEAIGACRVEAPRIAAALSRDGVRMGRASHRLRNPANAAPDWVRPVLDDYLAHPSRRAARAVAIAPGRAGYVEPIPVQPLCLACHGEALAPDVAAAIATLYPSDHAVGFREGDLRGVFWVEYPAAP
jgi:hypothetical protein